MKLINHFFIAARKQAYNDSISLSNVRISSLSFKSYPMRLPSRDCVVCDRAGVA